MRSAGLLGNCKQSFNVSNRNLKILWYVGTSSIPSFKEHWRSTLLRFSSLHLTSARTRWSSILWVICSSRVGFARYLLLRFKSYRGALIFNHTSHLLPYGYHIHYLFLQFYLCRDIIVIHLYRQSTSALASYPFFLSQKISKLLWEMHQYGELLLSRVGGESSLSSLSSHCHNAWYYRELMKTCLTRLMKRWTVLFYSQKSAILNIPIPFNERTSALAS